jgi:hypothetical protein
LKVVKEHAPNIAAFHYNRLFESVRNNDFAEYVEGSLPPDFSPRAIIKGDNVIVIAKDANGLLEAKRCIGGAEYEPSTASHLRFTDDGRNFQHFKWSKSNWVKFCAKVAFEFLCLFEGAEFCLRSEFDQVRSYATSSISKEGRKLTFNEHGPVTNNDMPMPVYVDLSKGQDCPQNINALLSHSELGTHTIDIYEINGWIYASISIAGFPPSLLVLGGPDIHLRDFYSAVYDDEEDEFHYLKLAYDKTMPVIPMHVRGGQMGEVAKTYNLKAI